MSYATLQDLTTRFGEETLVELTDVDGAGVIDQGKVDLALADADDMIDGHLAVLYALPLLAVPRLLVGIACDLARYNLSGPTPTQIVVDRRDAAARNLREISAGRLKLDVAGVEPDQRPDLIEMDSAPRRFSRHSLRGM